MSESFPTSTSAFAHRRPRADSNVSFTYYDDERHSEEEDSETWEEWAEEDALLEDARQSEDPAAYGDGSDDLELGDRHSTRRKSSVFSRSSIGAPLLRRTSTESNWSDARRSGGRTSQKAYIATEDLTIVIAGFRTSPIRLGLYFAICVLTGGLGYLLLRWLPRWRVRLIGYPAPLRECHWVAVENQWGEFAVLDITTRNYGRSLASVFGTGEKMGLMDYDEDRDFVLNYLQYLEYRYMRFFFHPLKDKFIVGNKWKDPAWTDTTELRTGLENEEKDYREMIFGKNAIDIEEKSVSQLLVDEAFHPFYVFQVASLILWSLDEYYYYAACIFIISLISITTTIVETRATMRRLREVSRFECVMRVLRNGFWRYVQSTELVPGDVYEVTDPSLTQLPCDSLLLSGDCIVNESMLTGESVPVSKMPVTDEALDKLNLSASTVHPEVAKHMLFNGTKIIRARRPQEDDDDEAAALALVVRTGFNTTKGALVRSMLFPKPSGFKFYRDSFRYISVMAVIALIGFIASFINFVRLGLEWHLIIVRALDLVTIVVPPALPATLTIGTNFALSRLKKKDIFCISPQRVNVGGKLDVICFDKTGTLTEDGLDVLGVRVAQTSSNRFTDILTDVTAVLPGPSFERDPTIDYDINRVLLYTMATCHSLRLIDGELLGDPLDVKMFQFTGWSFEEGEQRSGGGSDEDGHRKLSPAVARPPPGMEYDVDDLDKPNKRPIELGVLRTFEFVSQLRRASVVVRQFGAPGAEIYVKGAPECMKEICRPESCKYPRP
jgi:cation-transporting P-type ATPase 13A2